MAGLDIKILDNKSSVGKVVVIPAEVGDVSKHSFCRCRIKESLGWLNQVLALIHSF